MALGRRIIYTSEKEITKENILSVLQNAMPTHMANASRISYLLDYEEGKQPLVREKQFRTEIDIKDVDNVANEVTEFKLGFNWGYPITLIQRSNNAENEESINLLNAQYSLVDDASKTQELARFIEISGVGYTLIDINTDYDEDEENAYFTKDVIDPRNAFKVRSTYYTDKRAILDVVFREDDFGTRYYTCWTPTTRYEITSGEVMSNSYSEIVYAHQKRSGELNPLGKLPLIEWIRSYDRMGCFERQIDEMNALNVLASDMINASSEQVDCIWHANDVEFPTDENGNVISPKNNDWIMTRTSQDGKTPSIRALAPDYNFDGNLENYNSKRAKILQKCNVPQRNDNSGGSTGIAMSDATGWSSAETSASAQQPITEKSKMEELSVVLKAIKKSPFVKSDDPMLKIKQKDIKPNIKRNKNYELTVKSNALATLISHGVDGLVAFKTVNLFEDPNQAYADSKELIDKYQKSLFEKQNTAVGGDGEQEADASNTNSDNSDQIKNSPRLDADRGNNE